MKRVWHWTDFDSWRATIQQLLSDVLTPEVYELFRAQPPEYVVGDDLGWLDAIIERSGVH